MTSQKQHKLNIFIIELTTAVAPILNNKEALIKICACRIMNPNAPDEITNAINADIPNKIIISLMSLVP